MGFKEIGTTEVKSVISPSIVVGCEQLDDQMVVSIGLKLPVEGDTWILFQAPPTTALEIADKLDAMVTRIKDGTAIP